LRGFRPSALDLPPTDPSPNVADRIRLAELLGDADSETLAALRRALDRRKVLERKQIGQTSRTWWTQRTMASPRNAARTHENVFHSRQSTFSSRTLALSTVAVGMQMILTLSSLVRLRPMAV